MYLEAWLSNHCHDRFTIDQDLPFDHLATRLQSARVPGLCIEWGIDKSELILHIEMYVPSNYGALTTIMLVLLASACTEYSSLPLSQARMEHRFVPFNIVYLAMHGHSAFRPPEASVE